MKKSIGGSIEHYQGEGEVRKFCFFLVKAAKKGQIVFTEGGGRCPPPPIPLLSPVSTHAHA
jgi:hypothetical protein